MATITSLSKDERAARVALAATLEPDDAVTGRLIAAVGAVETVRLATGTGAFPKKVDAIEAGLWRNKVAPRLDVQAVTRVLTETDRLGLRVLVPGDSDWPTALNDLGERAPTALWLRGATSFLTAPLSDRVTITGARAATSYGEHVTGELASDLTHAERIIVAGGAYGIDAAAHRAALATGGQTLAVMVSGLDRLYPSGNRELLERVGDLGLLASEMPPGATPTKWRFLARNRILGALSGATVIAEAGYRSGSLNLAARAAQLGRPVGAVPGPVTSVSSAGTHRLLREGIASLITDATDVTALLDPPAGVSGKALARESAITPSARREGRAL
ncbi:DNA-processing protein DprA [Microbacterium oxydans]|uniref:DNA-processing protein DprA n=1 Tax=Microbacterium TaxID=33882 RepID=UPI0007F3EAC9|nr:MULTISPECIES: DNA-processing protein DprA [Microbacterium]KAB1891543.1 DNA-processing protein DprA [Microbacterium oxydans]OAN43144.1 DNA processing protein DprA [Microbacterium sp. H83]GED38533.1 DNA processing protein DprA [Microbacterium oxydans]